MSNDLASRIHFARGQRATWEFSVYQAVDGVPDALGHLGLFRWRFRLMVQETVAMGAMACLATACMSTGASDFERLDVRGIL